MEKATTAYSSARRGLENLLAVFFKHSPLHFVKRLGWLKLRKDLEGQKKAIFAEIEVLRGVAAEKRIDLAKASEVYFRVYQMIEGLTAENTQRNTDYARYAERQRVLGLIGRHRKQPLSVHGLDADLIIAMNALQRKIVALQSSTDYKAALTAVNSIVDESLLIREKQNTRLEQRQTARLLCERTAAQSKAV